MNIEIKEHPILFSGAMVRAILEGRKTQTRRVVKADSHLSFCALNGYGNAVFSSQNKFFEVKCPFGHAGDRLWVRESHSLLESSSFDVPEVWYWADGNEVPMGDYTRPRPSIHMFRHHSRLTLEIVSVRVERLQDISEEDAVAEGVEEVECLDCDAYIDIHRSDERHIEQSAIQVYQQLWDSINGKKHPWESNPWVWVVTFKQFQATAPEHQKERVEGE